MGYTMWVAAEQPTQLVFLKHKEHEGGELGNR